MEDYTNKREVRQLVLQYLLIEGHYQSLKEFKLIKTESLNLDQPVKGFTNSSEIINFLIKAFELGDRDGFFAIWNLDHLFNHRIDHAEQKKVEFYLQIYFTAYPLSPDRINNNHSYQNELLIFKKFLESQGSDLSQTSEFVTYYALPYVQNPIDHKSFKHLFTKDFSSLVRSKLLQFLELYIDKKINQHTLKSHLEIMNKDFKDLKQFGQNQMSHSQVAKENEQLKKVIEGLQIKLEQQYEKLIQIEQFVVNNDKSLPYKISNLLGIKIHNKPPEKVMLSPRLEDQTAHELSAKKRDQEVNLLSGKQKSHSQDNIPDENLLQSHQKKFNNYTGIEGKSENYVTSELESKDFNQIPSYIVSQMKRDLLLSNDISHICQILSQVRDCLRKACAESKKSRKSAIKHLFINHDIFSFTTPLIVTTSMTDAYQMTSIASDFIERMGQLQSDQISFQFLYLVNVMACDPLGISYLSQKQAFLKKGIWPLTKTLLSTNQSTQRLLIAVLQKFSLKKRFCTQMIKFGIVEWLLTILNNLQPNESYQLQYGLALLMNLTLHEQGQKSFAHCTSINVLEVLMKHFNSIQEHELETCINGSIYCLMNQREMRRQAKSNGLRQVLIDRLKDDNQNEQVLTQIRHILNKMDDEDDFKMENFKKKHINEQDQIIEEVDEEESHRSTQRQKITHQIQNIEQSDVEDIDDEGHSIDGTQDMEEEDEDEDDVMSISDFSNDQEFTEYVIAKEDPLVYFENRMLQNQLFARNGTKHVHAASDINKGSMIIEEHVTDKPFETQDLYSQMAAQPLPVGYSIPKDDSFLNKTKSSVVSSQIPVEMKHRDKIPRTPIDPELLAQVHNDNLKLQKDFDLVKLTKKSKKKKAEQLSLASEVAKNSELYRRIRNEEDLLRDEFVQNQDILPQQKPVFKFNK